MIFSYHSKIADWSIFFLLGKQFKETGLSAVTDLKKEWRMFGGVDLKSRKRVEALKCEAVPHFAEG